MVGEQSNLITWGDFAASNPDLAAFGAARFAGRVAYLATVRGDGAPRVHPVTPIIGQGRMFLFMEPTSPKGHDLRRGRRYAMHCAVEDTDGGEGEFFVSGRASYIQDAVTRAIAIQVASYEPKDHYILFELSVESAASTVYENGKPVRKRWQTQ